MRVLGMGAMVAALALAGVAAADPMESYYGNSVRITYPNGQTAVLHIKQGGSYDLMLPDGTRAAGMWSVEGDQFCTTRVTPSPQPKQCRPAMARNVGDKWDEDSPNGKVAYEMVAGD